MKVLSRQDPILSVTVACRFFARGDFARAQARPSRSKLRALPGRCRISVRQYRRTRDSSVRSTPSAEVPPVQCTLAADGRVSASHTKPRSLHIVLWYIECCCWFRACFAHVEPQAGGVVAGLVPAIHVLAAAQNRERVLARSPHPQSLAAPAAPRYRAPAVFPN